MDKFSKDPLAVY